MIKAALIDIDNTLLDFNESAAESIRLAFEEYGLKFDETTFPTFKRINDGLWLSIERGELTRERLHEIRFGIILGELGINFDGKAIEERFKANLFDCAIAVDGAREIMKYLSERYEVYAASNALYTQQINRLRISGMLEYFKDLFISERMGVSKPTAEFFDACFARMDGVRKDETVMIGDSVTADVAGAKEYGLKTIWFDHGGTGAECPYADFTVRKLSEITKIL